MWARAINKTSVYAADPPEYKYAWHWVGDGSSNPTSGACTSRALVSDIRCKEVPTSGYMCSKCAEKIRGRFTAESAKEFCSRAAPLIDAHRVAAHSLLADAERLRIRADQIEREIERMDGNEQQEPR